MTGFAYWALGVFCGAASVWVSEQILGVLVASVVASMMRGVAQ